MDPLLYGHAPDERLVGAHLSGDSRVRVYRRSGGALHTEEVPFFPFFHLSDGRLLEGFQGRHWLKPLEGEGYYAWLAAFDSWQAMWDAFRLVSDRSPSPRGEPSPRPEPVHLFTDPVTQYLLQSGRTMMKGMTYADLSRLQLDIETYASPPHTFPNAERPADRVILIALSGDDGWEQVLDGRRMGEERMLRELVKIVAARDPDVIEGHNIAGYDLPYLQRRADLHDVPLAFGRDGSLLRWPAGRQGAEWWLDPSPPEIAGRHVVDTHTLLQSYDAGRHELESTGLKAAARHFGFAAPDRVTIDPRRIPWHWDNDPEPLVAYALDDVRETRQLADRLAGSALHMTQMVPFALGTVIRTGAAQKIEAMLVRAYLRRRVALPCPGEGMQTAGGYTDVFVTGVVGPVVHADVESLYPSIMITRGIAPASDTLGVFGELLRELTTLRLEAKRSIRAAGDPLAAGRLDAMQSSFKILINSFYGYLGYTRGLFNDFRRADEVTRIGQEILRSMIRHIRGAGGRVIEADTDGIFFVPPGEPEGEAVDRAAVGRLSGTMPEGITVAMSGRYARMFSYKRKNYALLRYDGGIVVKGSSLVSRSMERFGRTFVRGVIEALLRDDVAAAHDLYVAAHRAIAGRTLAVAEFARRETLREPIETYLRDVEAGTRNRSAAYEIARTAARHLRPGDTVAYYITGNEPNPRTFEQCRPVEEWNPNFPDANVPYYLRRLDEFAAKFADSFEPRAFRAVFSPDDLFPFDPSGIRLEVREVTPEPPESPAEESEWQEE
jgi:DNA polymerase elongation subunit (family B)